jgi:hypothetical protein
LTDEDMAQLDELDRTGGTAQAVEQRWWLDSPRRTRLAFWRRT